jgi:NitT/TauT family transport system substrate-binding protein
VRRVHPLYPRDRRAIDWAYSGDAAIDAYATLAKVPRDLAQRTRDEFYPKQSLQLGEVHGLDLTLNQALEYKYITSSLSVADVEKGLIDIVYAPPK